MVLLTKKWHIEEERGKKLFYFYLKKIRPAIKQSLKVQNKSTNNFKIHAFIISNMSWVGSLKLNILHPKFNPI